MLARAERRPAPPPGTTWRVAVGARVIPGRGLGSRVRALSPGVLAAAECRVAAFSLLRGVSEMSQGDFPACSRPAGDCGGSWDAEGLDLSVRRCGGGRGVRRGGAPECAQGCPSAVTPSG